MDIQTTVACRVKVLASMEEDGTVFAKIVGHMPYATAEEMVGAGPLPEVSAEIVLGEQDRVEIGKVLSAIVQREQVALAVRMADARADARRVARQMGELI